MTQAAQDVSQELDDQLKARGLPTAAFIDNRSDKSTGAAPVIAVRRGERGYYPIFTQQTAQELNAAHGVSEAQAQAMHIGSMGAGMYRGPTRGSGRRRCWPAQERSADYGPRGRHTKAAESACSAGATGLQPRAGRARLRVTMPRFVGET